MAFLVVSHRRTRIDTENFSLWRNMGLLIDDVGRLTLTDGPHSLESTPEHARDKVLSYTLIRLLCKLVDYLAPPLWDTSSMSRDVNATYGNSAFEDLESQFESWFQMLSPSFHPDGTFVTDAGDNTTASRLFGPELWFSNDSCSTTMMYYHMACMLLLIHRPPEMLQAAPGRGTPTDLLSAFRTIEKKLHFHARQIIATVRGTPCDAVKLRAIQPLYVAGRCCNESRDREMLVEMLTDIQDSLGIATGYRVEALLKEWDTTRWDGEVPTMLATEDAPE